jgi:hypothetical protein
MTRKFIVSSLDNGIRKTNKNEFLIPNLNEPSNTFIGIESGKICQYGLVVYTGVDLDSNLVIERMIGNKILKVVDSQIAPSIEELLIFIKNCKVGDIIEVIPQSGKYEYKITGLKEKSATINLP